jgi:hypothetical protein
MKLGEGVVEGRTRDGGEKVGRRKRRWWRRAGEGTNKRSD